MTSQIEPWTVRLIVHLPLPRANLTPIVGDQSSVLAQRLHRSGSNEDITPLR
jgi:hypothetical protein